MSLNNHEKYKLVHNKTWIEGMEGLEVDSFGMDLLENQWMLFKPKYTESSTDANRLQTAKNRPGTVLMRKKNYPFGFMVTSADGYSINAEGRRYQASINDTDLRNIFDGNCYHFSLDDTYGVCFGKSGTSWMSILFKVYGNTTNSYDESFTDIRVVSKHTVASLTAFVDTVIYNNNFYTITFASDTFTVQRYDIATDADDADITHELDTSDVDTTSVDDLSGLSYEAVTSRTITISGSPTETIGRIWTVEYDDDNAFLAYECVVPASRSAVTGVTEGIVLIEVNKDSFLSTSDATLTLYVFDTLDAVSKLSDSSLCQAFIPDFNDEKKSFAKSISKNGSELAVGSDNEEAVYIFDLDTVPTPDIFSTPQPSLPTNGTKIEKDHALEQEPLFPIRMAPSGTMGFEISGATNVKWITPPCGVLTGTDNPSLYSEDAKVYYLLADSFRSNIAIDAHGGTGTSGYIGLLSDIPDLISRIDVSNTSASGTLNDGFDGTWIDIENTLVNKSQLEANAVVLNEAGNVSGTLYAADGMPEITGPAAVGAINSLIAKLWNVFVNMPFDDDDPMMNFEASIASGVLSSIETLDEDLFQIDGAITTGIYATANLYKLLVSGALNTPLADGYYSLNGTENGKQKWTNDDFPFNDFAHDGVSDWEIKAVPSGTYFGVTNSDDKPPVSGYIAGSMGSSPGPLISYLYN